MSTGFAAAYERMRERWPAGTQEWETGRTGLLSCGPPDAPPVVLLPGGGATATAWFAVAAALAAEHRVHAVDLPGDAGRTTATVTTVAALHDWLDGVLAAAGAPADLAGHSYGGWIALTYALRSPDRLRRLALLDPTQCFGGFSPRYLAHALPSLVRPSARRTTWLLRWEAGGVPLDPGALELAGLAATEPGKLVVGRRPDVSGLDLPTLVLLAGRSRAHDPTRIGTRARALLPHANVTALPDASHHSLPAHPAPEVAAALTDFLRP